VAPVAWAVFISGASIDDMLIFLLRVKPAQPGRRVDDAAAAAQTGARARAAIAVCLIDVIVNAS
jgi:hypothetical protein